MRDEDRRSRVSTGLEVRFELPLLRMQLRPIGALNPEREPFHPRAASGSPWDRRPERL